MNDEIKEILELTIQFVEEELDKGTPKEDIIKTYSTQVGRAFNHIKDCITNLQQENDRLTNELNTCMIERNNFLSRIEKANEIIDLIKPELWNISNKMTYRLIDIKNILNGRSVE